LPDAPDSGSEPSDEELPFETDEAPEVAADLLLEAFSLDPPLDFDGLPLNFRNALNSAADPALIKVFTWQKQGCKANWGHQCEKTKRYAIPASDAQYTVCSVKVVRKSRNNGDGPRLASTDPTGVRVWFAAHGGDFFNRYRGWVKFSVYLTAIRKNATPEQRADAQCTKVLTPHLCACVNLQNAGSDAGSAAQCLRTTDNVANCADRFSGAVALASCVADQTMCSLLQRSTCADLAGRTFARHYFGSSPACR
jgi:hypothetical protein